MATKSQLKQWRTAFRDAVIARDGGRCRICGSSVKVEAHHIANRKNLPNDGYATSNGITLCGGDRQDSCHFKAEIFHISHGERWEEGFHPNELYALIESSQSQAVMDSRNLK